MASQGEAAREREPEPRAREATGAGADHERGDVCLRVVQPRQQLVGVGKNAERARAALGERPSAVNERNRCDVSGGVEREDEAHVASG